MTKTLILLAGLSAKSHAQAPWQLVHSEPYLSKMPVEIVPRWFTNAGPGDSEQDSCVTFGLRHQISGSPVNSAPWADYLVPPLGSSVPYDVTEEKTVRYYDAAPTVTVKKGQTLKVTVRISEETGFQAWVGGSVGATAARQRSWFVYTGCSYTLR